MGLTMRELCPEPELPRWFALTTKYQHELAVEAALCSAGVETFCPAYRVRRRWSDRVKEINLPLFPGYVFGRFPFVDRGRVLKTPGVAQIVGFGGIPCPLPDREIEDIRTALTSNLPVLPWADVRAGDRVRIERGPLQGIEGIVLREKAGLRLVIGVELLRRSISVELDAEAVSALKAGRSASNSFARNEEACLF
ncbi:MAG TPA: UpxY family transcription antiterminator [Bryobacteraceae bacterium]|nr:UpxY family transcription antiterminator [Bryobacteraceae bacterium]